MNDQHNQAGENQYKKKTASKSSGANRRSQQYPSGKKNQGGNPSDKKQQLQMSPELAKQEKRRQAKKKMLLNNFKHIAVVMFVVIAVSAAIATVTISCINDVLPIHISPKKDTTISVEIQENMSTDEVIDALKDAGVIKNAWFCKLAAQIIGYSDDGYLARTYDFKRSMGLEKMLNEIKNKTTKTARTITLTFPEGLTVDQIISMLVENEVCTREELIEAMNTIDFSKEFDFLNNIKNGDVRYMRYEGYLFPDTYDFYLGENADSVLRKFFTNFGKKWIDEFTEEAEELGLTLDQVITLASIVEKEAVGADMATVASILLNRIDENMPFECDSTSKYMENNASGLSDSQVAAYANIYDTYICDSFPAGAICNPGMTAINAVLNAPGTYYLYFMHDVDNEMHVAVTLEDHQKNISTYGLAGG